MFKGYFLKVSGGYLSAKEQEELIRFILSGLQKYQEEAKEVRLVLEGKISVEELSEKTLKRIASLGHKWLIAHAKSHLKQ
ncbi:MAG: hypothetical protein HPY45_09865 [Anaerolineae bacterium]|nr:hypothetical protein [Anaerolineae bacterium]